MHVPSEMDLPLHRVEEGPVPTAADADVGALQNCLGADAHAAVIVAGGTAVVAVIPNGDAPCEMDSPPLHRPGRATASVHTSKELEGPVPSAGDSDVGALQNCLRADAQAAVNATGE
jgi:hypothetical protein